MKGKLYEKLYEENQRYQNTKIRHDRYFSEWKERFGYSEYVSFDKVLEDLYFQKYGKKPY